jgi:hypothetical protein
MLVILFVSAALFLMSLLSDGKKELANPAKDKVEKAQKSVKEDTGFGTETIAPATKASSTDNADADFHVISWVLTGTKKDILSADFSIQNGKDDLHNKRATVLCETIDKEGKTMETKHKFLFVTQKALENKTYKEIDMGRITQTPEHVKCYLQESLTQPKQEIKLSPDDGLPLPPVKEDKTQSSTSDTTDIPLPKL